MEAGSLAYVEISGRDKDTGELIETTSEEEARQHGLYDPTKRYSPHLVAVGRGWVLKGLDEALLTAEVGEEREVELPPEKAFGPRDSAKVKLYPVRKLGENASRVAVGDEVEVEGQRALVRYVGSGRVQLDLNPRYAGKTIVYRFKVVKKLEEEGEKVLALVKHHIPLEKDPEVVVEGGVARINLHPDSYLLSGLQYAKKVISSDIFNHVPAILEVHFAEVYRAPQPPPTPAEKPVTEPPPTAPS